MNQRNEDPGEWYPGPEASESSPDQYGQEHHGRREYGPSQDAEGQRSHGEGPQGYRGYRGGPAADYNYGSQGRPEQSRGYGHVSQPPFVQQPSGPAPFSHSAFGESNPPRYFGTGFQGHGGGTGRPQQRRYPMRPKGYRRSDERLREDISERLMQAHEIDSSEVTIQVLGGKVILEGTVAERYMKHAIEDLADSAPGVQDVDNRIRVVGGARGWGGSPDTSHSRDTSQTRDTRDMSQPLGAPTPGADAGSLDSQPDTSTSHKDS